MSWSTNPAVFDYKMFRHWRLKQGLRQEDVAHYCHVSINTISSIEVGTFTPRLNLYFMLCKCIGVPFGSFLKSE